MKILDCGTIVTPTNPEFYLKVNPGALPVKKVQGGWRSLDKKNKTIYRIVSYKKIR